MPPPRFVPCYLCGQQFGKSSLGIHQKQCYVKKMKQWQAAAPGERGPKPVDPETMQTRVRSQMAAASTPVRGGRGGCTTCGEPLDVGSKFCTECGTPVASPRSGSRGGGGCGECGTPLDPGSKFCTECGTRVPGAQAPPASSLGGQRSARGAVGGKVRASRGMGGGGGMPPSVSEFDMNQAALDMARTPCSICGRKFDPERIRRHEDACRTANRKRRVYDSHKHRIENTDMVGQQRTFNREVKAGVANPRKPQSNWRQKHQEFIRGIRAARQVNSHVARGGDVRDLPAPPPSYNPDYIQCPHCTRRFAPETAERHIPKCKNTMNRPRPPPSSGASYRQPVSAGYDAPRGYGRSSLPPASSGRVGTRVSSHHAGDYGVAASSRAGGRAAHATPSIGSRSGSRTMGSAMRNTASGPIRRSSGGMGGGGAFGGGGERFAPIRGGGGGGFGGGRPSMGGGGVDPRSNMQTTSVLGSGFLAHQTVYR